MAGLPKEVRSVEIEAPNDFHPTKWLVKLEVKLQDKRATFVGYGETPHDAQNDAGAKASAQLETEAAARRAADG